MNNAQNESKSMMDEVAAEYYKALKKVEENGLLGDRDIRSAIEASKNIENKSAKTFSAMVDYIGKNPAKYIKNNYYFETYILSLREAYRTGAALLNAYVKEKQNESNPDINADQNAETLLKRKKWLKKHIYELNIGVKYEIRFIKSEDREAKIEQKIAYKKKELSARFNQEQAGLDDAFVKDLEKEFRKITEKAERFQEKIKAQEKTIRKDPQSLLQDHKILSDDPSYELLLKLDKKHLNEYLYGVYLYINDILNYTKTQKEDFPVSEDCEDRYLCNLQRKKEECMEIADAIMDRHLGKTSKRTQGFEDIKNKILGGKCKNTQRNNPVANNPEVPEKEEFNVKNP